MREPCGNKQAEIDNDTPYKAVVNRHYDELIPLFDDEVINKAKEFKRLMMERGEAIHNLNAYSIVDAIEMIEDSELWSTANGDFTLARHYQRNKSYIKEIYLSGALDKFKTQIENEVNSLAQTVFKL